MAKPNFKNQGDSEKPEAKKKGPPPAFKKKPESGGEEGAAESGEAEVPAPEAGAAPDPAVPAPAQAANPEDVGVSEAAQQETPGQEVQTSVAKGLGLAVRSLVQASQALDSGEAAELMTPDDQQIIKNALLALDDINRRVNAAQTPQATGTVAPEASGAPPIGKPAPVGAV